MALSRMTACWALSLTVILDIRLGILQRSWFARGFILPFPLDHFFFCFFATGGIFQSYLGGSVVFRRLRGFVTKKSVGSRVMISWRGFVGHVTYHVTIIFASDLFYSLTLWFDLSFLNPLFEVYYRSSKNLVEEFV